MAKAAEAFRTISEVAADLDVPKHVLRFWEAKFPQIRPMKRGGGRRYYRPEDLELLKGIRRLLHAEGYTIKGVQKILREQGVDQVKAYAHVASADKASARGRAGKTDGVGRAPDVPKIIAKANLKGARGASDRPIAASVSLESLLQSTIIELEACRRLLLDEELVAATSPAQLTRARQG
ncbi:MAG: MerR family transcriptional regulator [Hyphomicrobium sp.]|nr:MerR family transcriptional regulator [Hyphomicrobium sp.]